MDSDADSERDFSHAGMSTDEQHDCHICGALFSNPTFLSQHIAKCSELEEDDNYDESGWQMIVEDVYDEHDEKYQSKVMMYEEGGMTEDKAKQQASEDMHHIYKQSLMEKYMDMMTFQAQRKFIWYA